MRGIALYAGPSLLVACPLLWSGIAAAQQPADGSDRLGLADLAAGWQGTLAWSLPIAIAAAILGWIPGRLLRERIDRGRGSLLLGGVIWVALIPPYATFYCMWRLLRPGAWLADWAAAHGHVGTFRSCVLAAALVGWLWPVGALCVATLAPRLIRDEEEVADLDPRTWTDRMAAAWRSDWRAIVVAAVMMMMALVGETTAFDVARVVTASSELRLLDAAGARTGTLWSVASGPLAVMLLLVTGTALWWRHMHARRDAQAHSVQVRRCRTSRTPTHWTGLILILALVVGAAAVPGALMAIDGMASGAWSAYATLHGQATLGSLASAGIGGALGAGVAAVTCAAALHDRRSPALIASGALWAIGAAVPGVLLATAYESMWNASSALRLVYDSMVIVPMAQVAHAGLVCWIVGGLLASRVPQEAIDVERLHGRGLRDRVRAHAPSVCCAAIGGGAVMSAYCVSETAIASRLLPPGADRVAPILMSAIHYQDQSAVLASLPWMGAVAAMTAAAAVIAWSCSFRGRLAVRVPRAAALLILAAGALALAACERDVPQDRAATADSGLRDGSPPSMDALDRGGAGFAAMASDVSVSGDAPPPLACEQVLGMRGRMPGRLDYPRAADMAPDGTVAVIDKSGRVQRFASDGTFIAGWRMPRTDNGMPTGVTIDRHGRLWIADTHEHRVLVCSPDGAVLGSFGGYGRAPGQFIYPTDVLMLDDADSGHCSVVVSEYGGNDRLQWLDVAIGQEGIAAAPVRTVGSQGSGPGKFLRPQSMSTMPDGAIAVADACNHRIVVLSRDGEWRGTIGSPGRERGQLSYPYGVLATASGDVLVAEFGNNRIQCLDAAGRGVWVRGGGGRDIGRLVAPWAIVGDAAAPVVVDAGNCRLLRVRLPDEGKR
jgi:hypothetical protein